MAPLAFWALVVAALATISRAAGCNGDNCLRAVRGTRLPNRPAEGSQDCSSFLLATVTPATFTSTVTETETVSATVGAAGTKTLYSIYGGSVIDRATATVFALKKRGQELLAPHDRTAASVRAEPTAVIKKRQVTKVPSIIPTYATACSGAAAYSSACSCIGVTASTTTVATPTFHPTTTSTTTTTTTTQAVVTSTVCKPPDYSFVVDGLGLLVSVGGQSQFYSVYGFPELDLAGCCARCFETIDCGYSSWNFLGLTGCGLGLLHDGIAPNAPSDCPHGVPRYYDVILGTPPAILALGPCVTPLVP